MAEEPIYIDLDAIEPTPIFIKLDGESHKIRHITLADWIANTKDLERLRVSGNDMEVEADIMIRMINRSFPDLTEQRLRDLPLIKLNRILMFAKGHNGTEQVEKEVAKQAATNPPSAPVEAPAAIAPQS